MHGQRLIESAMIDSMAPEVVSLLPCQKLLGPQPVGRVLLPPLPLPGVPEDGGQSRGCGCIGELREGSFGPGRWQVGCESAEVRGPGCWLACGVVGVEWVHKACLC
jgi:hypothetical protein